MGPTEILTSYRKELSDRRQLLLEQFPKFLPHDQYLSKCGQFLQVESDIEALNGLIRKANRANSTTEDE